MLLFSIAQSVLILAAFEPYAMFGTVMGYFEPSPYPTVPLLVNLAMVVTAIIFAVISVRRCIAWTTALKTNETEDGAESVPTA